MIRRFVVFLAALGLTAAPAIAQVKPLVTTGGQTRQLPAGTTLGVNAGTTGAASLNVPQGVPPTAPNNGDCWVSTAGWSCRVTATTVVQPPVATTQAALAALPSTFLRAIRTGYTTEGDVSPLPYRASGSACALNAGAGDNGSQVPTSDGKCWLATFPTAGIDVKQFGATCSNTPASQTSSNDTTAVARAVAYASSISPAVVRLPPSGLCGTTATVVVPQAVSLKGSGGYFSGFSALTQNMDLLSITGNSVNLENFYVLMSGPGVATSGWAVKTTANSLLTVRDLNIHGGCGSLDISGNYHEVSNVFIDSNEGSACTAIRVGHLTTFGNTVDPRFSHVTIVSSPANPAAACMLVEDAGGLWVEHLDAQICTIGTKLNPGTNQWVVWATISDSYLGDTTASHAFLIDTAAATAQVAGLSCVNCWASSSLTGDGVRLQNTGAGVMAGFLFNGLRSVQNNQDGFSVRAASISDVRVNGSSICSYGAGSAGFNATTGVSDFALTNSELRPNCYGRTLSGAYGVFLAGSNANVTLSGLDTRSNTTAQVAGVPTGSSFVSGITDALNNGLSLASAATITLSTVQDFVSLSGTTTVNTINGGWAMRTVKIITSGGAVQFTGGNICNTLTSVTNVPVLATYAGSCWYLK